MPTKIQKQGFVLILLCSIYTANGFNSYLTMFATTARPGNKLVNGLIYGVSEAIAAFAIGFVCKLAPDNFVFIGLTSVCIVSNIGYFFLGGSQGGAIAFLFYFFIIISYAILFLVLFIYMLYL